jgi:hypothetical protein
MKPNRAVAIWRVDIPFLAAEDWKYETSKAEHGRGGRTHTFGISNPKERLQESVIYQAPKIVLYRGKPTMSNGD